MDARGAGGKARKLKTIVIGSRPEPGRIVVTDPALRELISPPPSREAMRRMEALERSSARAAARMRDILLD